LCFEIQSISGNGMVCPAGTVGSESSTTTGIEGSGIGADTAGGERATLLEDGTVIGAETVEEGIDAGVASRVIVGVDVDVDVDAVRVGATVCDGAGAVAVRRVGDVVVAVVVVVVAEVLVRVVAPNTFAYFFLVTRKTSRPTAAAAPAATTSVLFFENQDGLPPGGMHEPVAGSKTRPWDMHGSPWPGTVIGTDPGPGVCDPPPRSVIATAGETVMGEVCGNATGFIIIGAEIAERVMD